MTDEAPARPQCRANTLAGARCRRPALKHPAADGCCPTHAPPEWKEHRELEADRAAAAQRQREANETATAQLPGQPQQADAQTASSRSHSEQVAEPAIVDAGDESTDQLDLQRLRPGLEYSAASLAVAVVLLLILRRFVFRR